MLYLFTFSAALILSLIFTPAARAAAIIFNVLDHPSSAVKTHKEPVPYLGGVAIFLSFAFALLWVRVLTSFPSGTLRALRGILVGGGLIFVMGVLDDVKPGGLHYGTKFLFQIIATGMLIMFGIQIKFIHPTWFALVLTFIWIVGITNAFNIVDIMDGLASGIGFVVSLFFLFISLPTEEIYVNFAAAALAGATLGFFPYNISRKWRIFMGDCGSLFIGFIAGSLALGTSYNGKTELGIVAPLLILAPPIFDTTLVSLIRLSRGNSPFLGSKDHFPLRMEQLGWHRKRILTFTLLSTVLCGLGAYFITHVQYETAWFILLTFMVVLGVFTKYILKAKPQ